VVVSPAASTSVVATLDRSTTLSTRSAGWLPRRPGRASPTLPHYERSLARSTAKAKLLRAPLMMAESAARLPRDLCGGFKTTTRTGPDLPADGAVVGLLRAFAGVSRQRVVTRSTGQGRSGPLAHSKTGQSDTPAVAGTPQGRLVPRRAAPQSPRVPLFSPRCSPGAQARYARGPQQPDSLLTVTVPDVDWEGRGGEPDPRCRPVG